MLKDLIKSSDVIKDETELSQREAGDKVEAYILAQTVTVQEMFDVVSKEYDHRSSRDGQISTWDILNTAKKVLLKREG
jgi:hypothetical protein